MLIIWEYSQNKIKLFPQFHLLQISINIKINKNKLKFKGFLQINIIMIQAFQSIIIKIRHFLLPNFLQILMDSNKWSLFLLIILKTNNIHQLIFMDNLKWWIHLSNMEFSLGMDSKGHLNNNMESNQGMDSKDLHNKKCFDIFLLFKLFYYLF